MTPSEDRAAGYRDSGLRARRTLLLFLGLAGLILLLDQLTKVIAVSALSPRQPVDVVGSAIQLVLVRNSGAAFSLGSALTPLLTALSMGVVIALLWVSPRVASTWWAVGLGLILGGAAGNLVDRLVRAPGFFRGHVVDFVAVGWWPVFNVADSALMVGVATIALTIIRGIDMDGHKVTSSPSDEETSPAKSSTLSEAPETAVDSGAITSSEAASNAGVDKGPQVSDSTEERDAASSEPIEKSSNS